MKIYCFGNEYIKNDKLAKELGDNLKIPNIEFIKCDKIEQILEEKGIIYIMDVVKGLKKPTIITNIDMLKNRSTISCHDFDLQFFLKLMKGLDKINEVIIIGLPMN